MAFLLLLAALFPHHAHLVGLGAEEAVHAQSLHAHVQQVVLAQQIADAQRLAVGGRGGHRHGRVGLLAGGEVEVGGAYVAFLAFQYVVELLVLALKEGHVGSAVQALEAFHHGLRHGAAFGAQGERQLVVLQHHIGGGAAQCGVEEGGGVGQRLGDGLLFLGFLFLGLLLGLFGLGLLFGHLLLLGLDFFFGGLVVPAESNQHKCYEHKADDSVFIHCGFVLFFLFLVSDSEGCL